MPDKDTLHPIAESDTPLWRFALALWQQEAARELCLGLQEQGWSVTRLLCAGWLARQGMAYSGREPHPVEAWRRNVTESIRSLRKSLSKSDSLLATLRERLASAELEAERIELYRAWLALNETDLAGQPEGGERIMELNLRRAAPPASVGINGMTESMIGDLAQLMTAISYRHPVGSHQA